MSQSPIVSVIMPVFNGQEYVAAAIESVLAQTYPDFELLITDDGSTDASLKLLRSYASQDPRIHLNTQKNRGLTPTLNALWQRARGTFIAVLEQDDVAMPDRLARQVSFLEQHPQVVGVSGAQILIDHQGRLLTCLSLPLDNSEIQAAALAGHSSLCHPGVMLRRTALAAIGGYDETLGLAHDLDLWLRLGEIGELANLAQPVVKYRLHNRSLSELYCQQQRQEGRLVCERAWQRRGIEGHFEATALWRPGPDRASQHHFMLKYGWWAFNSQQRQTAIIYGLKAIQKLPWTIAGWKLLLAALLKPLPRT